MADSDSSPAPFTIKPITNNEAYKGPLKPLLVSDPDRNQALRNEAKKLPIIQITERQTCDLELLLNGGFTPLYGFLNEDDYKGVVNDFRLVDGTFWPMPLTLDVSEEESKKHKVGDRVVLRSDTDTEPLAILTIQSIYVPDKALEGEKIFGSPDDTKHPAVEYLLNIAGPIYIGGSLEGIELPMHFDYVSLRRTPAQLREIISSQHIRRLVGFQTRNPMHRSHRELTLKAARDAKANILIHPVVGMTKPGDVDHYTRVRCYIEILKTYPNDMAMLSLLPIAMRMAGPVEASWHAIIRKNYGCTHFVVGRDHAGPGNNRDGKPFYDPYAAQGFVKKYAPEIGIDVLTYNELAYIEDLGEYRAVDDIPEGSRVLNISGTELRRRLFTGIAIPDWFSFTNVVAILRQSYPPRNKQGITLFFTGLSGSGKSTVANAVRIALLENGSRTVSFLDSKPLRKQLSAELGFSDEDRSANVKRIGYVASEITKAGGIAVVVSTAPFQKDRDWCKKKISANGGFVEIYVNTPLVECEKRDYNGLYAKARAGEIQDLSGVNAPYEAPQSPDITLDCSQVDVKQACHEIILWLEQNSYIGVGHL